MDLNCGDGRRRGGGRRRRRRGDFFEEMDKGSDRGVKVGVTGGVEKETTIIFKSHILGKEKWAKRRRRKLRIMKRLGNREETKLKSKRGYRTKVIKMSRKFFFSFLESHFPEMFYSNFSS